MNFLNWAEKAGSPEKPGDRNTEISGIESKPWRSSEGLSGVLRRMLISTCEEISGG